jgi:transcriptional regulator with XRE-family HTH domain
MVDHVTGEIEARSESQIDEAHLQLGQRLREARTYLGLSQEFVAEQLGIPRASVSAMESGKRKVTGLEIKQLAALYKRPVTFFLDTDDTGSQQGVALPDETSRALFRTARDLTAQDREQVLRFAQFLRQAGKAPIPERGVDNS